MRYAIVLALGAFAVGLVPLAARADIPPPVPPAKDVKFVIEVDEKAKAPKLIVPAGLTRAQFRPRGPKEAPKAQPPGKELQAVLEWEDEEGASNSAPWTDRHLMIAGVALALSLGLGGLWLVRRGGHASTRGLAILLAAGGTLAVATVVWANAAPPPPPKAAVVLPIAFDGNVNLEMVVGGDTIRLVLDKATYEQLKKEPKKPAGQ